MNTTPFVGHDASVEDLQVCILFLIPLNYAEPINESELYVASSLFSSLIYVLISFLSSMSSVQWSPTEADVFASCSVDGKIAIWDSRLGNKPALSIKAHNTDVNVISWNR